VDEINAMRKWNLGMDPIKEDDQEDDYRYGNLKDQAVREKVACEGPQDFA